MRLIDVSQHAVGVIAIGQEATGVIAIGQMATGFIAIGQLARGCFVIGQLALGLFGIGMLSGGVVFSVGMLGVGARGKGIILPLVPKLGKPRVPPETVSLQAIEAGEAPEGWVPLSAETANDGTPVLKAQSAFVRMPLRISRRIQGALREFLRTGGRTGYGYIRKVGASLVCLRWMIVPEPLYKKQGWWVQGAIQFVFLIGLMVLWVAVAGQELLRIVISLSGGIEL